MTSDFHRRVEETLQAVEDLDEGDRSAELERLRADFLADPDAGPVALEAVDTVERWFSLNPPMTLRSQETLVDLLDPAGDPESIGRYRVLRRMGEGPLAVVYEGLDPDRDEIVALKLLRPGVPSDEFLAALRHELPSLLLCRHPNLVRTLDLGQSENGRSFLVQELVEGAGLERFCERTQATLEERLELVAQVCDGLAHGHRRGHLHLGLTPRKIRVLRSRDGQRRAKARVVDLGVVPALSRGRVGSSNGDSGPAPWAVAPEQIGFGSGALDVDMRADVYGAGTIFYRLLTGRAPGETTADEPAPEGQAQRSSARLRRLLTDPVAPSAIYREAMAAGGDDLPLAADGALLRTLERDLDALVLRALARNRDRRHGSMDELAADLRAVRPARSVFSLPGSWIPRRWRR